MLHLYHFFKGALELAEMGCLPGACFRNLDYVEKHCDFSNLSDYKLKMLLLDAQTSGGLLISCKNETANSLLNELIEAGYDHSKIIGRVVTETKYSITIK